MSAGTPVHRARTVRVALEASRTYYGASKVVSYPWPGSLDELCREVQDFFQAPETLELIFREVHGQFHEVGHDEIVLESELLYFAPRGVVPIPIPQPDASVSSDDERRSFSRGNMSRSPSRPNGDWPSPVHSQHGGNSGNNTPNNAAGVGGGGAGGGRVESKRPSLAGGESPNANASPQSIVGRLTKAFEKTQNDVRVAEALQNYRRRTGSPPPPLPQHAQPNFLRPHIGIPRSSSNANKYEVKTPTTPEPPPRVLIDYNNPAVLSLIKHFKTVFDRMSNPMWTQRQKVCRDIIREAEKVMGEDRLARAFHHHLMEFLSKFEHPRPVLPEEVQWKSQQNWVDSEAKIRDQCTRKKIAHSSSEKGELSREFDTSRFFRADFAAFVANKYEVYDRDRHKELLKDPTYAAGVLSMMAEEMAVEFFEAMKPVVGVDSKDIKFDVKRDLQRVIEKIKDFSQAKKDSFGYKYVKDAVRMAFTFDTVAALEEAMCNLIAGHTPYQASVVSCFTVLEVKCKLRSVLRNVTVVVGLSGPRGERIVGEVQLIASFGLETVDVHFVEHLIYELRRMWGPDDIKSEQVTALGKLSKLRKVVLKLYSHSFHGAQELEYIDDGSVPCVKDIADEALAMGGSKQVFQAVWEQRQVAVGQLINPKKAKLFENECRLWCSLHHPNVVQVFGMCRKPPRMVMEWMDTNLRDYIENFLGRADPRTAVQIMLQITAGLRYVHQQGVLHRDIKPENIMVSSSGSMIKLADFGSAKWCDYKTQNHSENVEFTLTWTAPELFNGQPYSHAADIFSCGQVFYFILTGKPPYFNKERPAVLSCIHRNELPAWTGNGLPPVAPSLMEVVERCWNRPRPTASELHELLRRLAEPSQ